MRWLPTKNDRFAGKVVLVMLVVAFSGALLALIPKRYALIIINASVCLYLSWALCFPLEPEEKDGFEYTGYRPKIDKQENIVLRPPTSVNADDL